MQKRQLIDARLESRMSENSYPRFRVGAVQAGPVFMDREATLDKACSLIQEAGNNGARLVAFPEAFIPAYPYWARYLPPLQSVHCTKELIKQAVQVPSHTTDRLAQAARNAAMYVVVGINEKVANAHGTLFNTNLLIGPKGQLLGRHRKLVPTLAEKLVWASGDGQGLRVHETELGRLGSLICGENANPLARFVLIADGEQVHVANYLALPQKDPGGYNLAKDIEIRSAAHSHEGKVFTVVSSLVINRTVIDYFAGQDELQSLLSSGSIGHTAVYGPWGLPVAGPLEPGVEGILYADVDLEETLLPKLRHDIGGSYNRFDIMRVLIDRTRHQSVQDTAGGANLAEQEIPDTQPFDQQTEQCPEGSD
jgi:nitrilase